MRIFRRKRSRRKFRLTREGRAFLFVTVGVGLAAVNTANNLLYLVLGLLLSLLLVSGVLSDLALWKLRLKRNLPARLFAGRRSLIDVALLNEKRWLPSVSVEAIDEIDGVDTEAARFVRVGPGKTEIGSYRFESPRRGLFELGTVRVLTRYPFGLIEKGYTIFLPDETRRLSAAARARCHACPSPDAGRRCADSPDRTRKRVCGQRALLP